MSQQERTLIGTATAAGLLGVSKSSVKRMAADGRLPTVGKLDDGHTGATLFDRAVITRIAAERNAEPEPAA